MGIDGRGYYRALLPAAVRGESWLGVFVGAAFLAVADALGVAFLAMAVYRVAETVDPDTRVFDDGLGVSDFDGWVFLVAVACFDAGLRPRPLAITLSTPGQGSGLFAHPNPTAP
jgi:hypothetical protein